MTAATVTQGSGVNFSQAYDPATNHAVANGQFQYDADGNEVWPSASYDGENRMTSPDGYNTYVYDPSGKRVWASATGTLYFYDIFGKQISTGGNVYFGNRLVVSAGAGVVVTDRLGGVRAGGNGGAMSYLPYGVEQTSTPNGQTKFGTYLRDGNSSTLGADYADQRYYNPWYGRFNTPDPMKGGNAADPASWNKYAYTRGDPVNRFDPSGLDDIPAGYSITVVGTYSALDYQQIPIHVDGGSYWDGLAAAAANAAMATVVQVQTALQNADQAKQFISQKKDWSDDCKKTLSDAGLSPKDLGNGLTVDAATQLGLAADAAIISNGTASATKVRDLYANSAVPGLANLIDPNVTVSQTFAASGGTHAVSALGGNQIFIDPAYFSSTGSALLAATVMHELLHNATGLTDGDIMRNLGIPEAGPGNMGSFGITLRLFSDCLK